VEQARRAARLLTDPNGFNNRVSRKASAPSANGILTAELNLNDDDNSLWNKLTRANREELVSLGLTGPEAERILPSLRQTSHTNLKTFLATIDSEMAAKLNTNFPGMAMNGKCPYQSQDNQYFL